MREIAGGDWDEDEFREALKENLASGNFRLIVAVDAITDELKKTVLYLNRHSAQGIEVLALELDYSRDGELEILVPASYGEEVTSPRPRRKTWNEDGLFELLEEGCTPEGVAAARELWGFPREVPAERDARFSWGTGHGAGVSVYLPVDGAEQPLVRAAPAARLWLGATAPSARRCAGGTTRCSCARATSSARPSPNCAASTSGAIAITFTQTSTHACE